MSTLSFWNDEKKMELNKTKYILHLFVAVQLIFLSLQLHSQYELCTARSQSFFVENQSKKTIHLMRSTLQFIAFSIFFFPSISFTRHAMNWKTEYSSGLSWEPFFIEIQTFNTMQCINQYPIPFFQLDVYYYELSIQRNLCVCHEFNKQQITV